MMKKKIIKNEVIDIIRGAISEDLNASGDITSKYLIPPDKNSSAYIICKEKSGTVLSGVDIADFVLKEIDAGIKFEKLRDDGDRLKYMDKICKISGSTLSILKAERICLNFLQHMSGIADLTAKFVRIAEPYGVKIKDTRKTKPFLRRIEKYAVLCGGGYNHRFGLYDGFIIKDNHIIAAGGILKAIEIVRANAPSSPEIEVEVRNNTQLEEAIAGRADIIMLDNMSPEQMTQSVKRVRGKKGTPCLMEASGNINLENLEEICKTGVDLISAGAITHSSHAIDFSLEFKK
ncbi:MAG: carboxylating nicotinate-nucleotide diphosphorylase [Actinomycetota bacterium]|nr:carboxylating nicotinate-nucleotide diphosphorylase [Actinomycetota bacterium]